MKQYLSFFRIRFLAGLQYRAAAWAGIATQFAWGGMAVLMFRAFYSSGQNSFPMTMAQVSSYIWLQQALLSMYMTWFFDNDIFDTITSGSISYELSRPCDLYTMWFVKNMAIRLSRTVLRCLPILIFAAFLPAPYGIALPPDILTGLLALVSMLLGFLVLIAFSMLIYISAFFTVSAQGLRILAASVMEFLAGGVLPLPFFPAYLQSVMNLLPFASVQNTPFLIYVGHLDFASALRTMLIQVLWLVILVIAGRLLMIKATKKVVIQGG